MDSFEFNKIAGAVLAAALLAFGGGTMADIFAGGHGHGEKHVGYKLPVTAAVDSHGKAGGTAAPAFSAEAVVALLKTASAESGQAVFRQCSACHTADKGGKAGTGPNLWGKLGKEIASNPDFPRYSPAMKNAKGKWEYQNLVEYLHDPKKAIPGNQMAFAGVKNTQQLADLVAYLRSLSDSPVPLPN